MIEIAPGQIHLWLVPEQATPLDPALAARYAALLDADERIRWQRFVYAHDRKRFLLTRALARTVLAQYVDADPAAVGFSIGAHGKPALVAETPLYFNLSHTKGLVALAVTSTGEIGVDVEALSRKAEMLKLAARYFSPDENSALLALPASEQRERFFRLWTLKEAYVKARGLGLKIALDSFSFDFADELPGITFMDSGMAEHQHWFFHCINQAHDFRIALALRLSGQRLVQVQVYAGTPLLGFSGQP